LPGFGIETARDLLEKLEQEIADSRASNCLSERHALNAVWTAYHMHEWVWGDLLKSDRTIQQALGLSPSRARAKKGDFLTYLDKTFPAFPDAQALTNAAKHFDRGGKQSGQYHGAFSSDFSADFDISSLD
jgi:hypothetical protein